MPTAAGNRSPAFTRRGFGILFRKSGSQTGQVYGTMVVSI